MLGALDPWLWSDHTLTVLVALGTVGAVIVAVLGSAIRRTLLAIRSRRTRPVLTLSFDEKADLQLEAVTTGGLATPLFPALYVRLRVSNAIRRRAAEGVEVLVTRVRPVEPSPLLGSGWRTEPLANLGALGWTHSAPPDLTLGPGAARTVDLATVIDHPQNAAAIVLAMPVQPASGFNQLAAGSYEITLTVVARNVEAQDWRLDLYYDGAWISGEPTAEHLRVSGVARCV